MYIFLWHNLSFTVFMPITPSINLIITQSFFLPPDSPRSHLFYFLSRLPSVYLTLIWVRVILPPIGFPLLRNDKSCLQQSMIFN